MDFLSKITILGSVNMDIVITTTRMPKIGETIIGEQIDYFVGGKGQIKQWQLLVTVHQQNF